LNSTWRHCGVCENECNLTWEDCEEGVCIGWGECLPGSEMTCDQYCAGLGLECKMECPHNNGVGAVAYFGSMEDCEDLSGGLPAHAFKCGDPSESPHRCCCR
jgi:hypothetical protein